MIGPRAPLVHPQHRRGRHLLPFLIAILCGPLACSTDQPTEPSSTGGPIAAATMRHPLRKPSPASMAALTSSAPKAAYSLATAASATGPSVLVLADADITSTSALATSLANAGLQVTLRPAPEFTWDGTNPSLSGFDVVVHLNGATYDYQFPPSAQVALTNFVQNGGGYVTARWDGYEPQPDLAELALQALGDYSGPEQSCAGCSITYEAVPAAAGHPVLAGLPASFTFSADGHDAGPQIVFASSPSTPLMQVSSGRPAVLVREFGLGRIVNFSFAPNYPWDDTSSTGTHEPVTLQDLNIQLLYLNAVTWSAGSGSGTAQPQTITFGSLADRVYGDADFSISALASSGLPVSFITSGGCSVLGTTVSINAAGSCTITAQQAGNDDYTAAADVSQSFTIEQATPVINWVPAPLFSGTPLGPSQLNASATGLGGSGLVGSWVYTPSAGTSFGAGTVLLGVQFTPGSPNYRAAQHSVSISVSGSMRFSGFYAPLKNLPYVNTIVAGSAIPVKFSLGIYRGLNVLQVNSPSSVAVECSAGAPENTLRPGVAGSSGLRSLGYSYTYVWKTSPSWAGTCRRFILTLADGSTHEALFRFTAARAASTATTARRIIGK